MRLNDKIKAAEAENQRLAKERNELQSKLTALDIMLTAKGWGAAYGAVREDYPELAEKVDAFAAEAAETRLGKMREALTELCAKSRATLMGNNYVHLFGELFETLTKAEAALAE